VAAEVQAGLSPEIQWLRKLQAIPHEVNAFTKYGESIFHLHAFSQIVTPSSPTQSTVMGTREAATFFTFMCIPE
jgi:hypothetical protein